MSSHIGENIRAIRKLRKLTQEQLAESIGSKKSYIWKIENDTPKDASLDKISKIAKSLDVSLDYLLQSKPPEIMMEMDQLAMEKYKKLDQKRRLKVKEFIDLLS